jgi:hypothetical protein
MARKTTPVKYTDRDFESIKASITEHAKRHFSNVNKDFNEASFGAFMIDAVSYIGDVLSFYLDYQVNESFLETAIEYNNVVKLSRQLGYKFKENYTSSGIASFFVVVPRVTVGFGPDTNYIPTLKKGSRFSSNGGVVFTLNENVDFSEPQNRVVVASVDGDTGEPLNYAIRAYGEVLSGYEATEDFDIGPYEPLKKIIINTPDVTEIIQVIDSEGHEYHEVEYLSQDVIFEQIVNRKDASTTAPKYTMRPRSVPRRFTVENELGKTFLQFGYGSDSSIKNDTVTSVRNVVIKTHGRDYTQTENFDPSNLIQNDKLGISPSNTTISITYRINSRDAVNAPANTLKIVDSPILEFPSVNLDLSKSRSVYSSIEVNNESSILGDVDIPTAEEIKRRAIDNYASQNRAVTKNDYEALVYRMPPKFGAVKRVSIQQDTDSIKRNLNVYLISEDSNGNLTQTNSTIKENIKFWLSQYKMINDTIDILDSHIVNVGIEYIIKASPDFNRFEILENARRDLSTYFEDYHFEIGEALSITDIHNVLKRVRGVQDVLNVKVVRRSGTGYSDVFYDVKSNTSQDGRSVYVPENYIFEIKNEDLDIKGTIK